MSLRPRLRQRERTARCDRRLESPLQLPSAPHRLRRSAPGLTPPRRRRQRHDQLHLEASAYVRDAAVAPDDVVLRARIRGSEESVDFPVRQHSATVAGTPGARFHAEFDATGLAEGVWDLYVVQRFGADELENRLGRN